MHAFGIAGIRRGCSTGPEMRLADVRLEGRIGGMAVWRGLARDEIGVTERICRGGVAHGICGEVGETIRILGGSGHSRGQTGAEALGRVGARAGCRGGERARTRRRVVQRQIIEGDADGRHTRRGRGRSKESGCR